MTDESARLIEVVASRTFKVNMGDYESGDSFVSAKMSVPADADLEKIAEQLADAIDTLQAPDLELFKKLTKQTKSIAHRLTD